MNFEEHVRWLKISGWYINHIDQAQHLIYRIEAGAIIGFINTGGSEDSQYFTSLICDKGMKTPHEYQVTARPDGSVLGFHWYPTPPRGMLHDKWLAHDCSRFTLLEPLTKIEIKVGDLGIDIFEE